VNLNVPFDVSLDLFKLRDTHIVIHCTIHITCKTKKCITYIFPLKKSKEMLCLYSPILSQKILSDRLLLVVTGGQKSNLSYKFKLAPITTYYL